MSSWSFRKSPLYPVIKTTRICPQNLDEMGNFFQEKIEEHRTTFDSNNIRDVLDSYLFEIEKAKLENRSDQLFNGKNHDRQMQQIIGELKLTNIWSSEKIVIFFSFITCSWG